MKVKCKVFLIDVTKDEEFGEVLRESNSSIYEIHPGDSMQVTVTYDIFDQNGFKQIDDVGIDWLEQSCNCIYKPTCCDVCFFKGEIFYKEKDYMTYG